MYLMYVDESGDPGMVNSPTRWYILSGLVIHELNWTAYLEELVSFRQAMKDRFGLRLRDEIHASHFMTRPGDLAIIPKHQRLEILRRFADQLAGMPELSLINVVVDKANKPKDYDPFTKAWQALIQRFENTLSYRNFPGPKHADERGMLFPDRTDERKLRQLMRRMRTYNPVPNQAPFGEGYRNLQLRKIIEDANHRDSDTSYLIQAVDLCAYLLYQSLSPSSYMKKKSGHNYFSRLRQILCTYAAPRDPDGIVHL